MILLLTDSEYDPTVELVMDWLIYYKKPFKRLHDKNFGKESFKLISDVTDVWYWRWNFIPKLQKGIEVDDIANENALQNNIIRENNTLVHYFFHLLKDKNWLSSPFTSKVNKLIVLEHAQKAGFRIPEYCLIDNKEDLITFKTKNNRIITKSLDNTTPLKSDICFTMFYTKEILNKDITLLPDKFPVSFLQKFILKKMELRVFCLKKDFFTMAIFTPKSNVDYRKDSNSLRKVPYQLDNNEKKKIIKLMKELKLETASIDLMIDQDNTIYFLEINPIGHFSTVSRSCNFNLEKKIANQLHNV